MSNCPCCGYSLLRYTSGTKVYWFCNHCWQEMPNFEQLRIESYRQSLNEKIQNSPWTLEEKISSLSKKPVKI